MINLLGKSLALLHVGLSIMLMAVALALYFNAVDFGWEQPAHYWRAAKGKENVLVPSLIDKREAAMRGQVRLKREQLIRLAAVQDKLAKIDTALGDNRLEGDAVLANLQNAKGQIDILDVKIDENLGLIRKQGTDPRVGFPDRITAVPGLDKSYDGYLAELADFDKKIRDASKKFEDLQNQEKLVTERLGGELEKGGNPVRDKSGTVKQPGWYYLLESEVQLQREMQKELEYLRPLWVKELVDAQLVLSRRDNLLRRLEELGDKGFLTQSEYLRKTK